MSHHLGSGPLCWLSMYVAAGVTPRGGSLAPNRFVRLEACEAQKAPAIEQQRISAANADANARALGFSPQRPKNPRTLMCSPLEHMPT
jgi:hypothetical protein